MQRVLKVMLVCLGSMSSNDVTVDMQISHGVRMNVLSVKTSLNLKPAVHCTFREFLIEAQEC